jgi:ABC-type transport system involved in cytochrome c biogenesis permease component
MVVIGGMIWLLLLPLKLMLLILSGVLWLLFLPMLIPLFFLPSIIALLRGHQSRWAIFLLNLLLGWNSLCWIIALIWSATAVEPRRA